MRIKSLRVGGIGRFADGAHVEGFGPGVNVLAAGNEIGKSTLFRAIRTCLFHRHDSKHQEIRDLASDDSQLSASIELTFEHQDREYRIKKSFLRSPSAALFQDGREIARNKQADLAIWELLGVQPGSGRSVDEGAFGLLWVGQGASFSPPEPGAGATTLLNRAIESEVGTLVGGERARQVLSEIQAELGRSLTDTGRPKSDGPLHRAMREVEDWTSAEQQAQAKLTALEQQHGELLQRRQRRVELTDPVVTAQMTQELLTARTQLAEQRAAGREILRLEAEETAAVRSKEGAAQRLKQFRDLGTRLDANRRTETALMAELPGLRAREQEARTTLSRTYEQIEATEAQVRQLAARYQQLEKLAAAAARAERKDELARQLAALEQAARDLLAADAQLASLRIGSKDVDRLDEFDRQIGAFDAQLRAAAAHLSIEVTSAGAGKVLVGDEPVDAQHGAPVLASTRVTIGDLAVITVTPAANPNHDARQSLIAQRETLLRSLGAASVAEARAQLSRRRDVEATRKGLVAQLKTLGVEREPAQAIAQLKSTLAQMDAAVAIALEEAGRTTPPSHAALEEEKLTITQQRALREGECAKLQAARTQQQAALEGAVEQRSACKSRLEQVRTGLAADLAMCADADRSARDALLLADLAACETAHQAASAALAVARETAPDAAALERMETRCQRLEQALDNRQQEHVQIERDIGRLTGQIQAAGGDGVGESLSVAQEQRKLAERELACIQERIAVLQLLRDTVSACLAEGRERYFEPVRRHLRPFLNDLFPGADLELGDGYAIESVKRGRAESFRRLSDGTQEQIAVLVRLAMGSILAERGQAVPIILDDALVYCDDDRIQRMFDALTRAGKQQQIIVLTCRLRAFAPLGGHALQLQAGSGGGSALAA